MKGAHPHCILFVYIHLFLMGRYVSILISNTIYSFSSGHHTFDELIFLGQSDTVKSKLLIY